MIERRGKSVCAAGYRANTFDVEDAGWLAAAARSTESALTLEPILRFRLETFRQLL